MDRKIQEALRAAAERAGIIDADLIVLNALEGACALAKLDADGNVTAADVAAQRMREIRPELFSDELLEQRLRRPAVADDTTLRELNALLGSVDWSRLSPIEFAECERASSALSRRDLSSFDSGPIITILARQRTESNLLKG